MTIQILKMTIDAAGPSNTTVIFTLVGLAADAKYRQANFSQLAGEVMTGDDVQAWIEAWIADNQAAAQAAIDAGSLAASETENQARTVDLRKEARQFLVDNPQAKAIIDLSRADLEAAIQNRTAAQETLLLKTLAFAVRYLYESVRLLE